MGKIVDVIRSVFVAVVTLWIVDVTANLLLWQEMLLGNFVYGTPRDYLGLLLLEVQVAVAIAIASAILTAAAAFLLRSSWQRELVPAHAGVTGCVVMLAATRITWGFAPSRVATAVFIAFAAGFVLWLVLRALMRPFRRRSPRLDDMVVTVVWTALLVAFANQTVDYALQGVRRTAISGVTLGLVAIALVAGCRQRRRLERALLAWLPVAVAVVTVIVSLAGSRSLGRPGRAPLGDNGGEAPDIVLIVLDTARADHLDLYGYERKTMPALSAWARDAATFTRAISPAGWTGPAHASMLSGRPVSLHGLHYASRGAALSTEPFDGIDWLPTRLRDRGYYTIAVAANHRAIPAATAGFDRVITPLRPRWHSSTIAAVVDHQSPLMRRVSERLRWRMPYADAREIVDMTMSATPRREGPVFLMVNVMDTHSPYNPPQAALRALGIEPPNVFRRYREHRSLTRLWPSLPDSKRRSLSGLYDGELRWMDTQIARLFGWIDERFGDDVIVIVTSDHGEELGEEGRIGHEYGLPQTVVHVPLVVRGPGIAPGVIDSTMSTRMLDPFIAAAANGEVALEELFRRDAPGVVTERYGSAYNVRTLGDEYGRPWVCRFAGRYKAIGPSASGFELLDVGDTFLRPRRASGGAAETALAEWIDAYWEAYRDRREETADFEPPTEEELKALRSLGYID